MGIFARLKKLLGSDFDKLTDAEKLAKIEEFETEENKTEEDKPEEDKPEEATEDKDGEEVETAEGEENPPEEATEPPEDEEEKPGEMSGEEEEKPGEMLEEEETTVEDEPAVPEETEEDGATNGEESEKVILDDGWLDTETYEVVPDKVHDPKVLEALQTLVSDRIAVINNNLTEKELAGILQEMPLNVSIDSFYKLVDFANVTVKEGKVYGVREAVEELKAKEPNFFKDLSKASNPLKEGFNPVKVKATATKYNTVVETIRHTKK